MVLNLKCLNSLKRVLTCLAIVFCGDLYGFVLLSGPEEARLEVSAASPRITFLLENQTPPISKKEEYQGGIYAGLSDDDLWPILISDAMDAWNQVEGSFVELAYQFSSDAVIDANDLQFSIAVSSTDVATAAFARPRFEDGVIYDCDITISSRKNSANNLAFTILHELGHCLGLGHNHSDFRAVMGYARTDRSLTLGVDDEIGLIYLYPIDSIGKPEEMIQCGSLGVRSEDHPYTIILLLLAPLALSLWRRVQKD